MNKLYDSYKRIHNYLRISLTDSCNFRCIYCMPDEPEKRFSSKELMQSNEILEIARVFVSLQINKIRLTGGEPLLRHDFTDIVKLLSELPVELTLTTNGVLLHKNIDLFKERKIKSVNISIDSLDKHRFKSLTKRNMLSQVWDNIVLFVKEGFHIKLNVVIIKGINDHEILDFISLTYSLPIHIRFIEFMPFSGNKWKKDSVFTMNDMLQLIEKKFSVIKINDYKNDTDKKYKVLCYKGTFAFITTISNSFCNNCNRMRLSADGKMKNCLFSEEEYDILKNLREEKDIIPVIKKCLLDKHKKMGGKFESFDEKINLENLENIKMVKIGG